MEILRTSSYIIPVKLESVEGKYMLIHGYTGAMDIVDSELKSYIFTSNQFNKETFPFADEIFEMLKSRGYLTIKTKEEERIYVQKISLKSACLNQILTKTFTFLITYKCNFKCPYCYEQNNVQREGIDFKTTISKEMVDKAFLAMNEIEPNSKLHNKVINLFGGEPLLKENRQIIKYIVDKGKALGYRFSATSNGYDLDSYEDMLGNDAITSVQVTIDGSKYVHNIRRIHNENHGTFDKIITNIQWALEKGIALAIRINVDAENINEVLILDSYFQEIGLFDYDKFTAYAAYIGGDINYNPSVYNLTGNQRVSLQDFYATCSQSQHIQYDISLCKKVLSAIKSKKCLKLLPIHCGAQAVTDYIFDPFGHIYSCLDCVGNKGQAIGTYINHVRWNEVKEKWTNRNVGILDKCCKCKLALLCGGGCYAKVLNFNIESYCDGYPVKLKNTINRIYKHLYKQV